MARRKAESEDPVATVTSRDVIRDIAQKRGALMAKRLELSVAKANVKTAESELDLALSFASRYAESQLAFELEVPHGDAQA